MVTNKLLVPSSILLLVRGFKSDAAVFFSLYLPSFSTHSVRIKVYAQGNKKSRGTFRDFLFLFSYILVEHVYVFREIVQLLFG